MSKSLETHVHVTMTDRISRKVAEALSGTEQFGKLEAAVSALSLAPKVTSFGVTFPVDRETLRNACVKAGFRIGSAVKDDDHGWTCHVVGGEEAPNDGAIVAQVTTSGVRFVQVSSVLKSVPVEKLAKEAPKASKASEPVTLDI